MSLERERSQCSSCGYPARAGHKTGCVSAEALTNEKIVAILRQSPSISVEVARKTAEDEVANGKLIEGVVERGFGWYRLEGEDKETMEGWKSDVTSIFMALHEGRSTGDFSKFFESTGEKFRDPEKGIGKILAKLIAQEKKTGIALDEEAEKLLAIGLWLWEKQGGEWKRGLTELHTVGRMVKGSSKVGDAAKPGSLPNCVETSFLIRAIAREIGVDGEVRTTPRVGVDHRYFQTSSGKIMDYWWMRETAGLALTSQVFDEARPDRNTGDDHDHGPHAA